jgi:hypothetical protein
MDDRRAMWLSRGFGVGALLIAVPHVAFVTTNLLRYQFGLLVDESTAWWYENTQAAPLLLGALGGPLLAMVLATLAMARFGLTRDADGAMLLTARFQPNRLAIVAGALSAALALVIIGYGISESALEAIRR